MKIIRLLAGKQLVGTGREHRRIHPLQKLAAASGCSGTRLNSSKTGLAMQGISLVILLKRCAFHILENPFLLLKGRFDRFKIGCTPEKQPRLRQRTRLPSRHLSKRAFAFHHHHILQSRCLRMTVLPASRIWTPPFSPAAAGHARPAQRRKLQGQRCRQSSSCSAHSRPVPERARHLRRTPRHFRPSMPPSQAWLLAVRQAPQQCSGISAARRRAPHPPRPPQRPASSKRQQTRRGSCFRLFFERTLRRPCWSTKRSG